jgi:molybdopterin molybdotransferase
VNTLPVRLERASASEVLTLARRLAQPLGTERILLRDAVGRVLRESLRAPEDQPAFDRSSMDGYAVRRDDTAAAFQIVDEIRAGDWKPRELQPGEAVRISTGGALPGKDLKVIMSEDAEVQDGMLRVKGGDDDLHIRFRGEDARAGQMLVEERTLLHAGAITLLASLGCTSPLVTRLPRVLHLATGNEIVPPEQLPARGQIRDSNSSLVRAFLRSWNVEPVQLRVSEDESEASKSLADALPGIDLLLISGGASVGEHDFTQRLLESFGFAIHVSKTTARPGKPLIFAQSQHGFAFGLPGNPLAHYVCLNLYVRALLEGLAGRSVASLSDFHTGLLASDFTADANSRETYWPARWALDAGAVLLTPLSWSSSGDLTALAMANALVRVTVGARSWERGRQVEFLFTDQRT